MSSWHNIDEKLRQITFEMKYNLQGASDNKWYPGKTFKFWL